MDFLQSDQTEALRGLRLPRYEELPGIDLYMDQVIATIERQIAPLLEPGGKAAITATMIANYVKQGVVVPPIRKKYTRAHLAYLIVVCILKRSLTLAQICDLIHVQVDTYPTAVAYDYFCDELEAALREVFSPASEEAGKSLAVQITPESEAVRKSVRAFANSLYIDCYLSFLQDAQAEPAQAE